MYSYFEEGEFMAKLTISELKKMPPRQKVKVYAAGEIREYTAGHLLRQKQEHAKKQRQEAKRKK